VEEPDPISFAFGFGFGLGERSSGASFGFGLVEELPPLAVDGATEEWAVTFVEEGTAPVTAETVKTPKKRW
jgi:hypothetical protein